MAKQKENYLDYVPKHNSLFEFRDNKKGHVEIKVHNFYCSFSMMLGIKTIYYLSNILTD